MTLFGDSYFFMIAILLSIPAIMMGYFEKNIKNYGLIVSLFLVFFALKDTWNGVASLAGYCLFELVISNIYLSKVLKEEKKDRSKRTYHIFLILSLMPLLIWKISAFNGHAILGFMGISYMTFKTAQIIIEIYDGLIKELDAMEFLYFLVSFQCISSGPIDRSRRFHEDMVNVPSRADYLNMLGDGIQKILIGMFYKFVIATGFYQMVTWLGHFGTLKSNLIFMYSYGLYLFFDFAGYSLMAIGFSYIFGIKAPENFNKPFLATDMKDFWNRWHMSLSFWFRDFVFSRFMMAAIRGKWFANKLNGAACGFIINMSIMGAWHGLNSYYLLYGLYHGLLLAATEVYQKKSKFHKKHKKNFMYKGISLVITFNLVMFGLYIFSGEFTRTLGLTI